MEHRRCGRNLIHRKRSEVAELRVSLKEVRFRVVRTYQKIRGTMRIIRTTFLLGVLTLFLMIVGQYFGGRNGMSLGLGIAICMNAFAYFFSDKIALLSSGARPVHAKNCRDSMQ